MDAVLVVLSRVVKAGKGSGTTTPGPLPFIREMRMRTMSETSDPNPDQVAKLLKEDRERRMQDQETRRQVKARHVGIEAFRKGSVVPDALFEQKTTQRRTWTVKIMEEMAKHPGTWFEKYYVYDKAEDVANGPSSTSLMFNRAHEGRTGKNKQYADFIEKHGGRFFAEYTTNPIEPTSPANPYPGKWVHVIRVKWIVSSEHPPTQS